jgi:hypothetical protein
MNEEQAESVPYEKEVPVDAPDEDELELIDEEDEELEPDTSEEAATEAGMSHGGAELPLTENVEFEEDDSGVAR